MTTLFERNAQRERDEDTRFYRMLAAGEAADTALAEREFSNAARQYRAQAEAAAQDGYFESFHRHWVVFTLTDPDPEACDLPGMAGVVEHGRIVYYQGAPGCANPGDAYRFATVRERHQYGTKVDDHRRETLADAVAAVRDFVARGIELA